MTTLEDASVSVHTDDDYEYLEEEEGHGMDLSPLPVKVGIITGTGMEEMDLLEEPIGIRCCTPFGKASDTLVQGYIENVPCILIKRHGLEHNIMPSNINYRANIWALRKLKCTHCLMTNSFFSVNKDMTDGDFVVPHDFFDMTTRRAQTFYDGNAGSPYGVCHVSMLPVFHERVRKFLIEEAESTGYRVHDTGKVAVVDGPRYNTRLESKMFGCWGCDVTSQTLAPECVLAKEAGLIVGSIGVVACQESHTIGLTPPTVLQIAQKMFDSRLKLSNILRNTILKINDLDWTEEVYTAKVAVCQSFITRE